MGSSAPSLPTDAILRASLGNTPEQQHLTLAHRDFGFTTASPNPQDEILSAGQEVLQTLGPFVDAGGRRILVDVLASAPLIPVTRQGETSPFLYISSAHPVPFTGIPNLVQYSMGPGSVWMAASLFTADAPASLLAGVQISSGRLVWSGTPIFHIGPDPTSITVPTAAVVSVSLVPVPTPAKPGASPPPAEFSVQTPSRATFKFTQAAAALTSAGDSKLTVLGDSLILSEATSPATYDASLRRLQLTLTSDKDHFSPAGVANPLVKFGGTAPITAASWALSLVSRPSSPGDNSLPVASGSGGLSVTLGPGLDALPDFYNTIIRCGACAALAEGSSFVLNGLEALGGRASVTIRLWSSSQAMFRPQRPFRFRYANEYDGNESWATLLPCRAKLDQPRTINNERLTVDAANAALVFARSGTNLICAIQALVDPERTLPRSFALKNLLAKTRPRILGATGEYAGGGIADGTLSLSLAVLSAVPFLPDPYTMNLPIAAVDAGVSQSTLSVTVRWQAYNFSSLDVDLLFATGPQVSSLASVSETQSVSTATASLLDLSTNVSQFGVSFLPTYRDRDAGTAPRAPSVKGLYLQVPSSSLAVMALPAVQWEPVVTDPNPDSFESPLSFPNCGPPTLLVSNSVTLTPIAPRQAIDTLLADYNANPPSAVTARFTLPFGLVAEATLTRTLDFLVIPPTLDNIRPGFAASNLQAGDQLSIGASRRLIFRPPGGLPAAPASSPSIPGKIQSLQNAHYNGSATTDTILGFTQNPRIPVTRVDLSGFGESIFSDWRNPSSLPPSISKVALDVLVGRTAKEVVQAFSILYPYGVPVVRTITIERENSARVVRHDSGWQATGDGRYSFPVPTGQPQLVTHPGLVGGVVAVQNIRDLTSDQMYKISVGSETIELMPVKFDCFADVENVVLGGTPRGVPALDQLGYVQITKVAGGSSLTAEQYATLLRDRGPLGGMVDCVTDIGRTGFHMRLLRIGAGASRPDASTTNYQFSMAAFGAPVFPKVGGQWSFVMAGQDSGVAQSVDAQKGVPVIRQKAAAGANPPALPYRFANPEDLLATQPASTYCLVHSTTAYRLLFPQPKIEATGPHQISSVLPLFLADAFALSTSSGAFPQIDACILIDDANWKLNISSDGANLSLQMSNPTYTVTPVERVLHNNVNIRSIAYTNDAAGKPSVVTLAIDTASSTPWSCHISNLSLAIETASMGELSRVVGALDSSALEPTAFADPKLVFGPKLSAVAALVSFLELFGPMPALDVGFGSVSMSLVYNLQKFLTMPSVKADPVGDWFEKYVTDLDFKFGFWSTEEDAHYSLEAEVTFKIPAVPQGPSFIIIFLAKNAFEATDKGDLWSLTVGAGYGYQGKVLGFGAYCYAAVAMTLAVGSNEFLFGMSLILRADIDLEVVEAQATAEVRGEMIHLSCGPDPTDRAVWAVGQFTLAVEITIFAVLDIEFDYTAESKRNTDNGPCQLPDS